MTRAIRSLQKERQKRKERFALFCQENKRFARKTKEQISNPDLYSLTPTTLESRGPPLSPWQVSLTPSPAHSWVSSNKHQHGPCYQVLVPTLARARLVNTYGIKELRACGLHCIEFCNIISYTLVCGQDRTNWGVADHNQLYPCMRTG